MKKLIFKALRDEFKAKKSKNEALLNNYLTKSAGIGEHPDIIEECSKIIEAIASAQDCLNSIEEMESKFSSSFNSSFSDDEA